VQVRIPGEQWHPIEHFRVNAADRPDIHGLLVVGIADQEFRGPVPPRRDVIRV
jgi:hypothetical protein